MNISDLIKKAKNKIDVAKSIKSLLLDSLKGIFYIIPLIIVVYVINYLLGIFDIVLDTLFKILLLDQIIGNNFFFIFKAIIGILLILFIGFVINLVIQTYVGEKINNYIENIIQKFPLIRNIYTLSKDLMKIFKFDKKGKKKGGIVVLVEYPSKGTYVLAMVSLTKPILLKDTVSVYIPTAPNPTSGFNVLYNTKDIYVLEDISVDDAMKFIIGLGGIEIKSFTKIQDIKKYKTLKSILKNKKNTK